jgi:hypothetical protein
MVAGRWFTEADRKGAPKVVVISERAARSFYPNENPIGRIVAVGQGGFGDRAEIVGMVGDVRYGQVHEAPKAEVYLPILQSPIPRIMLFVRAEDDPALLAIMVRRLVASTTGACRCSMYEPCGSAWDRPPRGPVSGPCCWPSSPQSRWRWPRQEFTA